MARKRGALLDEVFQSVQAQANGGRQSGSLRAGGVTFGSGGRLTGEDLARLGALLAQEEAALAWRDECEPNRYGVDPADFDERAQYDAAVCEAEEAAHAWRKSCGENRYGVNPEDYETEAEYARAVREAEQAAHAWRGEVRDNRFGVRSVDYETREEYERALERAAAWRESC